MMLWVGPRLQRHMKCELKILCTIRCNLKIKYLKNTDALKNLKHASMNFFNLFGMSVNMPHTFTAHIHTYIYM